jgi:Family of unknown function (DUF6088)
MGAMQTISYIRAHINRLPADAIFTSRDFLCYGKRTTIDSAINRLIKKEMIFRIARGVFVKWSTRVAIEGILPSALKVAQAKARGFGKIIFMHKKDAACHFGLLQAGNESPTFATFGRNTSFQYGEKIIHLVHVSPKGANLADKFTGLFIRALKQVGNHKETSATLWEMLRNGNRVDRTETASAASYLPSWVSDHLLDDRVATNKVHSLTRIKRRIRTLLKYKDTVFKVNRRFFSKSNPTLSCPVHSYAL